MCEAHIEFWIDVGGTFTDCIMCAPGRSIQTHKLLSSGVYKGCVGPASSRTRIVDRRHRHAPPGFFDGYSIEIAGTRRTIARFLSDEGAFELAEALEFEPRTETPYEVASGEPAPITGIRRLLALRLNQAIGPVVVRLGTTRGTNALLERNGAATAFVTTAGFADVLRIGEQDRPALFDLHIRKPIDLYRTVVEIDERIDHAGRVLTPIDSAQIRARLAPLLPDGIQSLAICLMNAYRNPSHERAIGRVARELGFAHVSLSSEVSPLQRIVSRGDTTVVDAYVTPVIKDYVDALRRKMPAASIKLMTSSGGLVEAATATGKDSILSGPAGGVVGYAHAARQAGFEKAIGFDMGGTSTDVSRFDGHFERRYEMRLEDSETQTGVRIVAPMLAIETVAAGGGSICRFDGLKPVVGPRSAGADPGPACYGRGGPFCLTDAHVLLGRIPVDHFAFPLDLDAINRRLEALIDEIHRASGRRYQPDELASGFLRIANENMAAAVRKISIARGYDVREHVLVSFGGAGGQHACAIADLLGIRRVLLHPLGGVLSAYGIGIADVRRFAARDVSRPCEPDVLEALRATFVEIEAELREQLIGDGAAVADIRPATHSLDLRYRGQNATITVARPNDGDYPREFVRLHRQLYGFDFPERPVDILTLRVELVAHKAGSHDTHPNPFRSGHDDSRRSSGSKGWHGCPVFVREDLRAGFRVDGPAIIAESIGTVVVERGWQAELSARGDLILTRPGDPAQSLQPATDAKSNAPADPIQLELFNNRFAAAAEQMGITLQRTALSTNVKERLDFSCAIFDAAGELVVNAPHIPVHLGAMSECVRELAAAIPDMRPGDVYVTNHPLRGGTHLPDITVITPVFIDAANDASRAAPPRRRPGFFVASRAHHAEIGGITPGSMPPLSKSLADEGALIDAFRMVREGRFAEAELRALLTAGAHPSRRVDDNIADVNAQAAANRSGVTQLRALIEQYGLARVQTYMGHIREAAERKMRAALARLPDGRHQFMDFLDDGSPLAVAITIDGDTARVDFTGTADVLPGNLNANRAIVGSAVLYCFRCLIEDDIPLNAGVLAPITIHLPRCFLNPPLNDDPHRCAAFAGGNVETSQRIVDAIFGALKTVAASQGTMNNLLFGDDSFGYYETIGGGAGAGPDFDGAHAVHTHMTNTRLTDPEVLEDRYPVRLRRFAIRTASGGVGLHCGGDGIIREIEFLKSLDVSLLSQRRRTPPYGLLGGKPGKLGRNTLLRGDGTRLELEGIAQIKVGPGDVLRIKTPGGGGFGRLPVE